MKKYPCLVQIHPKVVTGVIWTTRLPYEEKNLVLEAPIHVSHMQRKA